MSSLLSKGNGIFAETATDLSASIGKFVTFSAGVPSVVSSATTFPTGIVLDARKRVVAGNTTNDNAIGAVGGGITGTVRAKIKSDATAIKLGDELQLAADGTLTNDAGSGNRVILAVCAELKGAVAGDLADVVLKAPTLRT